MYLVKKHLPEATPKKGVKLIVGEKFEPRYFNGAYKLYDDGRRSGTLHLKVGDNNFVTGYYYSDKDGANSVFERELTDADIVISQPFWPAYLTAERIAKAPKLKLAITAGIGSDHVDLQAAMDRGMTVAEVTYFNSISV